MIVDALYRLILHIWSRLLLPLFRLLLFFVLRLLWASHRLLLTSILPIILWQHLYFYLINLYLWVLHRRSYHARHDSQAPPLSSTTTSSTAFNRCLSLSLVPRHQHSLTTTTI